jgi:hypothetical protein
MFTVIDRIENSFPQPDQFPDIESFGVSGFYPSLFVNVDILCDEGGIISRNSLHGLYSVLHKMPHLQVILVSADIHPVVVWKEVKNSSLRHRFRDALVLRAKDPSARTEFIKGYATQRDLHTYVAVEPEDAVGADCPSWIFAVPRTTGLSPYRADELANLVTRFEIGYPRP